MTSAPLRSVRLGMAIVLIAVVNFVAGRLGLLLAIPPGYATAVFPPAGIALACLLLFGYRVWPGVWLGSFCINLSLSPDPLNAAALLQTAPVAAGIATGSALQALAGAWLVRRFVGFPDPLDTERAVVRFLGLGGPASCVIAAGIGVTTLWWAGILPGTNVLYSAWTWWVGDTLGVLIFTPLVLIWGAEPRALWRRRSLGVALPLGVMLAAVVGVFVRASGWEQDRIYIGFSERAEQMANALVRNLDGYLEILYATEGFYAASERVERDEFRAFGERMTARHPALLALEWVPRVAGAERERYEAQARHDGYTGFQFTELAQRRPVPVAPRDEYFPIYFVAPEGGNEVVLGFDLGSEPTRRETLERARDTGRPAASAKIARVLRAADRGAAVLVGYPIYRPGPHETIEERRANLEGFAVVSLRLDDIVQAALQGLPQSGIALQIEDDSAIPEGRELYGAALGDPRETPPAGPSGLRRSFSYAGHGRPWTLRFSATPDYLAAQSSWQAWAVLAAGLLFSSIVGAFLLVVTGRSAQIEALVTKRTADLTRRNAEIQRFYHTLSHELKTPLTAAREFVAILLDGIAGPLGEEQREYLGVAKQSCNQMKRMLDDLLDAARLETGKLSLDLQPANIGEITGEVLAAFAPLAEEKRIRLRQSIAPGFPEILIDRQRIAQVLTNLLNNALKFTEVGGEITAKASPDPKWPRQVLIAVSDTGRGIAKEHLDAIFERLYQVQESDTSTGGGLGLGLSLCRGIIRLHGGEIWVESEPGKGSTFYFTLPEHVDVDVHRQVALV